MRSPRYALVCVALGALLSGCSVFGGDDSEPLPDVERTSELITDEPFIAYYDAILEGEPALVVWQQGGDTFRLDLLRTIGSLDSAEIGTLAARTPLWRDAGAESDQQSCFWFGRANSDTVEISCSFGASPSAAGLIDAFNAPIQTMRRSRSGEDVRLCADFFLIPNRGGTVCVSEATGLPVSITIVPGKRLDLIAHQELDEPIRPPNVTFLPGVLGGTIVDTSIPHADLNLPPAATEAGGAGQ